MQSCVFCLKTLGFARASESLKRNQKEPVVRFIQQRTMFGTGFQASVEKFLIFVLVLYLTGLAAASIAFFFSSIVSVVAIASAATASANVINIASLFQLLFPLEITRRMTPSCFKSLFFA